MKIGIVVLAMLMSCLMCGCWASISQIKTPNGSNGYSLSCRTNAFQNISKCYQMASEACPYGYTVLDRSSQNGVVYQANQYGSYAFSTHSDQFIIQCQN